MLFRKDMEPRCAYCVHAAVLDEDRVGCVKKGILSPGDSCRNFSYDPFKRSPAAPAAPDFSRLKEEDFSL